MLQGKMNEDDSDDQNNGEENEPGSQGAGTGL